MENLPTIVIALISAYEVLSRIVPTTKTWSIIGNILAIAKLVSEYMDNVRK